MANEKNARCFSILANGNNGGSVLMVTAGKICGTNNKSCSLPRL